MRKVSKLGIYLPTIILVIALVIAFTAPKKDMKKLALQEASVLTPTSIPTPTISIKINLNLRGPFVCQYEAKTSTISASIKNKQIAADFVEATQSSHFIVRDGCLYSWNSQEFAGSKQCGMGTAIDTIDFLSSMGLLDFGSIMSMVPASMANGTQADMAKNTTGIQKFLETCEKHDTKADAFTLPLDRSFVEVTPVPGSNNQ